MFEIPYITPVVFVAIFLSFRFVGNLSGLLGRIPCAFRLR
jgi:hypothetical protein